MKAKQRIDKILESVIKKVQEEVTALIGASLVLSESENTLISKEDFFDQPAGKQIVARMDITGEIEGAGCLLVKVKDAIRLGGTLIMLPLNELEQTVADEDYSEETKDSFGEIANIIAGAYTKVFEEMYPQSCRFVRKDQDILIPAKVDIESDQPVPNQLLYQVTSSMKLDDVKMGELTVLLPAEAFGLVLEKKDEEEQKSTPDTSAEATEEPTPTAEDPDNSAAETEQIDEEPEEVSEPTQPVAEEENAEAVPAQKKSPASFDVQKHRKRIDALLGECLVRMEEEVSALLGVELQLTNLENRPVSKEQYFLEEASGKQVLAHIKVTGACEDKSYLLVSLQDAIRIGGILIMLPPQELDEAITEDDFSVDSKDAYGEIANIISGAYSAFFEERYTKSLRFIRTDIEEIVPLTVDTASSEPMPDQTYYLSSSTLVIEGTAYGQIQMLFPLSLLELDGILLEEETIAEKKAKASVTATTQKAATREGEATATEGVQERKTGVDIILMSDDIQEAEKISGVLQGGGYTIKTLSFKNNINDYVSNSLKAVFLVMNDVNEQAFGVIIKVSSSCSVPLIAAGPAWTRTKVIKAVKYGVNDILLTPATEEDIQEKIDSNLARLAA